LFWILGKLTPIEGADFLLDLEKMLDIVGDDEGWG